MCWRRAAASRSRERAARSAQWHPRGATCRRRACAPRPLRPSCARRAGGPRHPAMDAAEHAVPDRPRAGLREPRRPLEAPSARAREARLDEERIQQESREAPRVARGVAGSRDRSARGRRWRRTSAARAVPSPRPRRRGARSRSRGARGARARATRPRREAPCAARTGGRRSAAALPSRAKCARPARAGRGAARGGGPTRTRRASPTWKNSIESSRPDALPPSTGSAILAAIGCTGTGAPPRGTAVTPKRRYSRAVPLEEMSS
jgi:hypothetical protein